MSSEAASSNSLLKLVEALKVRDYRLLWTGGFMSYIGDWMDQVTLAWLVLSITGSPFYVGLLHGCRFLPLLVFGLWGGVLADKFDRRVLLIRTQMASALVTLGLALVAFQESPNLILVFVLAIARGSLLSFDRPSRHSIMPSLVPRNLLMNAVALQSAAHNMSRVLGPAIAGTLIALVGTSWSLLFTAALFIPNLAALLAMKVPAITAGVKHKRSEGGIRGGLAYVWSDASVAAVLGTTMVLLVFAVPYMSLLPVFARDVLLAGPAEFGVLNAASGAGSLIGTIAVAWMGPRGATGRLLIGAALAFSAAVCLFSLTSWLIASVLALLVVGACSQAYFTASTAVLQAIVPDELRGRVMSIYLMDRAVVPAGSVLAGALASLIGVPYTLIGLAAASAVIILLVAIRVPVLRRVGMDGPAQTTASAI